MLFRIVTRAVTFPFTGRSDLQVTTWTSIFRISQIHRSIFLAKLLVLRFEGRLYTATVLSPSLLLRLFFGGVTTDAERDSRPTSEDAVTVLVRPSNPVCVSSRDLFCFVEVPPLGVDKALFSASIDFWCIAYG